MKRQRQTAGRQVRLATFENETMARMAAQRLLSEGIPSVVRSLGPGPGMWGTAYNLPHALEVLQSEVGRSVEILGLPPADLAEGADRSNAAGSRNRRNWLIIVGMAIAVVLIIAKMTADFFLK